jgi:hypothetical protein
VAPSSTELGSKAGFVCDLSTGWLAYGSDGAGPLVAVPIVCLGG